MKSFTTTLRVCVLIISCALLSCQKKDIPPTILNQTFSVDENTSVGTLVGKIIASDEDGQVISYAIKSGNTNDAFKLSESDGTITVNNQTEMDYETNSSFVLSIEVKDNKSKNAIATITINLNNIDETPRAVSISVTNLKYGNILTIYGKYFNTQPGITIVSLSNNSQVFSLTPLLISTDSIKVVIYNQQVPTAILDLGSYRIGINTSGTVKWSDLYLNLVTGWIRVSDFQGPGRYKSTAFSLGSNCYVGGGASTGVVYKDFWKYNPGADTWTQLNDVPGLARVYPRSFASSSYGFVGSGYTTENSSKVQLYDFYKYDPQNSSWTTIPNYPDNILNYYVGYTVTVNGRPFVSLSNQNIVMEELNNDLWVSHNSNTEMIDCPAAGTFSIGDKFYVVAGYRVNNTINNALWEYNITDGSWTKKANFPGPARFAGASFSIGNFGYYGCGMAANLQQFKDMWRYDPSNNTWMRVEDFPGGERSHTISTSVGNYGYIGLGYIQPINSYLHDFWKYSPSN